MAGPTDRARGAARPTDVGHLARAVHTGPVYADGTPARPDDIVAFSDGERRPVAWHDRRPHPDGVWHTVTYTPVGEAPRRPVPTHTLTRVGSTVRAS